MVSHVVLVITSGSVLALFRITPSLQFICKKLEKLRFLTDLHNARDLPTLLANVNIV